MFSFALSIHFQCFPMQCLFSSAGKQFPGKHSAPNIFISSLYHCVRYHHSDYNQRLLSNEVIFDGVKNNLEHWNGETEQHPEVDELRIMDLRVIDYWLIKNSLLHILIGTFMSAVVGRFPAILVSIVVITSIAFVVVLFFAFVVVYFLDLVLFLFSPFTTSH